jgi:hypothetical protein
LAELPRVRNNVVNQQLFEFWKGNIIRRERHGPHDAYFTFAEQFPQLVCNGDYTFSANGINVRVQDQMLYRTTLDLL